MASDLACLQEFIEETIVIAPNVEIIKTGSELKSLYTIAQGWACRYKTLPDGRRAVIGILLPGDITDLPLQGSTRSDTSVKSLTRLTLLKVSSSDIVKIFSGDNISLAMALWRRSSIALAIQREWTCSLSQRSASERLGSLICEIYFRLEAIGLVRNDSFDFPLSQRIFSSLVGLSLVHGSKQLQEMRRLDLFQTGGRMIQISDLHRLIVYSNFCGDYLYSNVSYSPS